MEPFKKTLMPATLQLLANAVAQMAVMVQQQHNQLLSAPLLATPSAKWVKQSACPNIAILELLFHFDLPLGYQSNGRDL